MPIHLFNICCSYCRINGGDYRISCSFSRFSFYLSRSFNSNVYRKEQLIVFSFYLSRSFSSNVYRKEQLIVFIWICVT